MVYKFPISGAALTQSQKLAKIYDDRSVIDHIYLILTTSFGEYKYQYSYGCTLWQHDFDISKTESDWSNEMTTSLTKNIKDNEPRISPSFRVDVKVIRQEADDIHDLRQLFSVKVSNLILLETNEKLNDVEYDIVFSPISIE